MSELGELSGLGEPVELDVLGKLGNSKPRNLEKNSTENNIFPLHIKHVSSDTSQTDRRSGRTSKIGGA